MCHSPAQSWQPLHEVALKQLASYRVGLLEAQRVSQGLELDGDVIGQLARPRGDLEP